MVKDLVTVLIVEEDRATADLVMLTLQRYGYQVASVSRPSEAIKIMNEKLPDLTMIDLFLPEISGLELLELMKKRDWLKKTRVVVISALGFWEVVQQAISLGAKDFIVKPFDVDTMAQKIGMALTGN